MKNLLSLNRLFWLLIGIFTLSLSLPILYLANGNSICTVPSNNLWQYGNAYSVLGQNFAGCFSKGIDSQFTFTITSISEKGNEVRIYEDQKYIGQWEIKKGITKIIIPSPKSIISLRFFLKEFPPEKEVLFLNQKRITEFKVYYGFITLILCTSLLILVIRFRDLIRDKSKFFFVLWFFCFSIYFLLLEHSRIPLSGDEPQYLLVAESILEDHDLNLKNQFEGAKPSLLFRNFDHHTVIAKDGSERSIHYPLLSVYLIPSLINQFGEMPPVTWRIAKVLMILISSSISAFLFFFALPRIKSYFEYILIPLVIFGMPSLAYSNQIYPEVLASFILFASYILLCWANSPGLIRSLPLLLALLPFIHLKFLAVSVILISQWAWKLRKNKEPILYGVVVYLAGIALFILYNYIIYQKFSPYSDRDMYLENIVGRYIGYYIFDIDRGILALNPLLFFFTIGFIEHLRKNKIESIFVFLTIASGHIPNLLHTIYWLGASPTGRYWVAVVPIISFISIIGIRNTFGLFKNTSEKLLKISFVFLFILFALISLLQSISFILKEESFHIGFNKRMVMPELILEYCKRNINYLFYSYSEPVTFVQLLFWSIPSFLILFLAFKIFNSRGLSKIDP